MLWNCSLGSLQKMSYFWYHALPARSVLASVAPLVAKIGFFWNWTHDARVISSFPWPVSLGCSRYCPKDEYSSSSSSSFSGHYSRTTQVSQYQNVEPFWILMEQKMLDVAVVEIGILTGMLTRLQVRRPRPIPLSAQPQGQAKATARPGQ